MSEAKRYGVRQSERADGCEVTEPGGRVMARTLEPWQAERIARLLNSEAEVRAFATRVADGFVRGESSEDTIRSFMAEARSILSALGEE